jgi:ammonia channel protein AmtB
VIAILLKLRSGPLYRYNHFQVAAGTILLFALWLFLAASSGFRPLNETDTSEAVRANVALNILLSGAVAGFVAFELAYLRSKKYSLFAFSRGLIAGVVIVSG